MRSRTLLLSSAALPSGSIWNDQFYVEEDSQQERIKPRKIIDKDFKRQVSIYEVTMRPPLGLQLIQTKNDGIVVDEVLPRSNAALSGIMKGDKVVATSATFGDQIWPKSNLEGIISALNTRFFLNQPCTLRLERSLKDELPQYKYKNQVTETYQVSLAKPLGIEIEQGEGDRQGVYVKTIMEGGNADKLGLIQPGDKVVAVSASLGDDMWETSTVEGVVSAVTTRKFNKKVSLRLQRTVELGDWVNPQMSPQGSYHYEDDNLKDILYSQQKEVVRAAIGQALKGITQLLQSNATTDEAQTVIRERSVSLLQAFGKAESSMAINYLINQLKAHNVSLDDRVWNSAMSACLGAKVPQKALEYFQEMQQEGICRINRYHAATLVKVYSALGDLENANKVLWELDGWGVEPDVAVANALLAANVRGGDLSQAELIFKKEMPRLGIRPNARSYNILINGYSRAKNMEKAYSYFDDMNQKAVSPDIVTLTTLMKGRMAKGELTAATKLLIVMEDDYGISPDIQTYNTLISGLMKRLRWQEALQIEQLMKERGVQPDQLTYSYLISGLVNSRHPLRAIWKYGEMKQRGVRPNVVIYTQVITAFAKRRSMKSAVKVLKEMKEEGVKPNIQTFSAVMEACIRSWQPAVALQVFTEVKRGGFEADLVMLTLLIRAFGQQGELRKAFNVLKSMRNKKIFPNIVTYNALIEACCQWGQYGRAFQVLQEMLSVGYTPNGATLMCLISEPSQQQIKSFAYQSRLDNSKKIEQQSMLVESRAEFLLLAMKEIKEKRNRSHSSILYLTLLEECLNQNDYELAAEVVTWNQVYKQVFIRKQDEKDIEEIEKLVSIHLERLTQISSSDDMISTAPK